MNVNLPNVRKGRRRRLRGWHWDPWCRGAQEGAEIPGFTVAGGRMAETFAFSRSCPFHLDSSVKRY